MIELTRKAYNRKYLMVGVSIFMSIALISTGFAAWVMSSVQAPSGVEAPVVVSVVQSGSVTITVDQWSKQEGETSESWHGSTLNFDAEPGDWSGRMRNSAPQSQENSTVGAQLLLPISGSITNPNALSELKLTFTLPDSLTAAINAGYLAIDQSGKAKLAGVTVAESSVSCPADDQSPNAINGNVVVTVPVSAQSAQAVSFEYVLTFTWGTYFAGMNPSLFYDNNDPQKKVTRAGYGAGGTDATLTGSEIASNLVVTEMEAFTDTLSAGMDAVHADASDAQSAVISYSGSIEITVEGVTA